MNRELVKGMAIGIGVGLAAPVMLPVLARIAKPSMNAVIRAGIMAWERGREAAAEFGEYAEDMMAEARSHASREPGEPAVAQTGGNGEARGA
ncbi:MAG: DUF5132 domain-containing protein [Magnetospirillum sp.]|nr:DUF5132 domain-containing protein [Magnetospirillum sp.]